MTHLPRALVVALSGPTYRLSLNDRLAVRTQRRLCEASVRLNRVPRGTCVERVTLGGRPAERVTVGATERPRAILYLHGGGYVLGSARMYRPMAAHLARAAGAVAYALDYRLAPEHPYPAALEDTTAAFRALVAEHGFAPSQIAIAGDSAGGGLAVAAARVLTDEGLRPAALGLLSPWTDPCDESMPERDFVVNKAWGRANAARYRGTAEPGDPGFAPMHGSLDGLPPMLVHYGAREMLSAQIKRFAALAADAGCDVRLVEHPALWHSGHILAGMLRDATDATHDVGVFLRAHLDGVPEAAAARAAAGR
jgi:acetyl esterase/lipase